MHRQQTRRRRGGTQQTEGVGVMCPTGSNTEQYEGSARSSNPIKLGKTTEARRIAVRKNANNNNNKKKTPDFYFLLMNTPKTAFGWYKAAEVKIIW